MKVKKIKIAPDDIIFFTSEQLYENGNDIIVVWAKMKDSYQQHHTTSPWNINSHHTIFPAPNIWEIVFTSVEEENSLS